MLFGWKAAETLKVDQKYRPSTGAWKRYFDAINRNAAYASYVASEDEAAEQGSSAGFLATAVTLLPMAFVAYIMLLR